MKKHYKNNLITDKKKQIHKFWTESEIKILKEMYLDTSLEKIKIILNRSDHSIIGKARSLGLYHFKTSKWTEKQIDILKTSYSTKDINEIVQLTNHPIEGIRIKANLLGLHKYKMSSIKGKFLEPEWWEKNYFIKYHPREIAKMYGVNIRKVICRASNLQREGYNIQHHKPKKNFCDDCKKQISPYSTRKRNLCKNCSAKVVYKKRGFINNNPNKPWTEEEIEFLKKNFEHRTCRDISKEMNRSISGILKKGKKLGLKKNKESFYKNLYQILDYRNKNINNNPKTLAKRKRNLKKKYKHHPELLLNSRLKRNCQTKPEKEMENILKKLKVKYLYNQYVKTKKKWRFPDFQVVGTNIIIEVDGEYWHSLNPKEDLKRQKELEDVGFQVIRFTDKEIEQNKKKVIKCLRQKLQA